MEKIGSIFLFVAIFMAIFLVVIEILNSNKTVFGVRMANINIGWKKDNEIKTVLEENWKNFKISFGNGEQMLITVSPENIGINIDAEKSLKKANQVGRRQNIIWGIKEELEAIFSQKNLPLECNFNEEKIQKFIATNFEKFETPPKNSNVVFNKESGEFEITPPEEGFLLEREKLKNDLKNRVSFLEPSPIILEFKDVPPEVKENGALEAREIAQNLVSSSPYFIFYKNERWKIDTDSFLDWMVFYPISVNPVRDLSLNGVNGEKILKADLSENKIKDFLIQLSPVLNLAPQNAKLSIENGKVTTFSLSHPGRKLKIDETTKKIVKEILEEEKQEIELEFVEIEPEITTSSIENLGITTLLGKGTSNFAGSPKNRIYNIKLGLAKLQGALIGPGEEFSFGQVIGEIDEKNGFLPELVIKRDKTTPEPGGGMCQVSTTLFRAAINSGLEITERYPHAYPVVYYSPQGFDATVYPPHPDLKFRNDTPAHILIQGKVSGTILTFELYGTSDGRKVIVSKPQEYDKKPDGSMKAKFDREIWKDGELIKKETFYSSYKSPKLYPKETQ